MYFEYQNFEGENDEILEIVSSDSVLGLLKRIDNKNIKISLPLCLDIGKLDGLKSYNRNELLKYCRYDKNFDFYSDIEKLIELSKNAKKIRVWSSHLDSDDYCLLLFICNLLKDKNISVIFSEEFRFSATTISCCDANDILNFENKEHILKKYEIEDYCNEWKKVIDENSELRFMINGNIVSCNIDYFDNKMLDRLKELGEIPINQFVASLMVNPIIPRVIYSDWIYIYLINELEKKKLIKFSFKNNEKYISIA